MKCEGSLGSALEGGGGLKWPLAAISLPPVAVDPLHLSEGDVEWRRQVAWS